MRGLEFLPTNANGGKKGFHEGRRSQRKTTTMEDVADGAKELILDQIALVLRMQEAVDNALDRNDSQSAQRWVSTLEQAFSTLLEGLKAMSIDLSNLSKLLTSTADEQQAIKDLGKDLGDRLTKIEDTLNNVDAASIAQLQTDVSDIKKALEDLNTSAGGSSSTPTPAPTTPTV